jgi:hypothetical protein
MMDEQVGTVEECQQQSLEIQKERDELKQLLNEVRAQSKCQIEELQMGMQREMDQQVATMEGVKQQSLEFQKERDDLKQLLDELQAQSKCQSEELAALRAKAAAPLPPPLVKAQEDPVSEEPIPQDAEIAQLREQASRAVEEHAEHLRSTNAIAEELRSEIARLQGKLAISNEEAAELRKEVVRLHSEGAQAVQRQELEHVELEQLRAQLEELHSWSGRAVQAARVSEGQLKAQLEQVQKEAELSRAKLQAVEAENQLLQATRGREPAVPTSVAALLIELKALVLRSQHSVPETKPKESPAWVAVSSICDVEAQLRDLCSMTGDLQSDLEAYLERARDKADKQTANKIQEFRLNAEKQLIWLRRSARLGSG